MVPKNNIYNLTMRHWITEAQNHQVQNLYVTRDSLYLKYVSYLCIYFS